MAQNPITRRLAVLVLALALIVSGAPVAMAATGMGDCGMAMGSMAMQESPSQDQHGMDMTAPMQKQQMPCKDMGGFCTATGGAIDLPQVGYSPVLAGKPAVSAWPVQAELASVRSRPDIPPPIAVL